MLSKTRVLIVAATLLLGVSVVLPLRIFLIYREAQVLEQSHKPDFNTELASAIQANCSDEENSSFWACVLLQTTQQVGEQQTAAQLVAQQDSAAWSLGILLLGIPSLLFSALGLWALVWTFLRTRRLSEDQSRAYVMVRNFNVSKIYDPADRSRYQLVISFEAINCGDTPALDLTTVSRMGWSTEEKINEWAPSTPTSRGVIGPGQLVTQSNRLNTVFFDTAVQSNIDQGTTIWARGVVEYQDVFGQRWRHSFKWFLKDPDNLLNINDPVAERDDKFRDFGMTVHNDSNCLEKV